MVGQDGVLIWFKGLDREVNTKMSELKDVVFQHYEEAKRHVDRVHDESMRSREHRIEVLERLQQAYVNKDQLLIDELEEELKKHVGILKACSKARKNAYDNVFDPALNNVLAYLDKERG